MTVTLPPPTQQVTEKDFWIELWYRTLDDMVRAINDTQTDLDTVETDLDAVEVDLAAYIAAPVVPIYTVVGLPSAATVAQVVYVSNESGGAVLAFSDGVNWRRVTDRAIVT